MQIPLQISYRHLETSESLNLLIEEEAQKLTQFFDRITRCKVTVEQPHQHHRQGKHYRIHVELSVPGQKLSAGKEHPDRKEFEDPRIAVTETFKTAGRQLQDYARKLRGEHIREDLREVEPVA